VLILPQTHNYWEPESAQRNRIVSEGNNMALEPLLFDNPDVVIKFMLEKYSKSERTMKYIESCARADITLGGEQQQEVIEGFDSLENYLDRKKWRDAPVPRIQQEPGWDNMPIRKRAPSKAKSTKKNQLKKALTGK
jgi:hypothetical protein